jgi:hypothetical protein
MVIPSGYLGDFLLANWTNTVLFFPETEQLSSTFQIIGHFDIKAMLEVGFPLCVERVSFPFYLDVPFEVGIGGLDEGPGFIIIFSLKYPMAVVDGFEVCVFDPCFAFIGVSSFGPLP